MAGEFIKDGEDIVLNVPYAEAYLSESLFKETDSESAVATEYGEGFKIVGIFNMRFFKSDAEPRDSAPLRTFNYPNSIVTFPENSTIQKLELIPGKPERYRILQYYLGDVVMSSEAVEAVGNCTKFLHMIIRAKIPTGTARPEPPRWSLPPRTRSRAPRRWSVNLNVLRSCKRCPAMTSS